MCGETGVLASAVYLVWLSASIAASFYLSMRAIRSSFGDLESLL